MTLKDIAEKAGVSMMTVSNVIHGKHNRVSDKTIEKVNAIIKEYNYVPNLSARTLTNKTSHIIAIVLSSKSSGNMHPSVFENPYVNTMVGTMEHELFNQGYYTMIHSVQDLEELEHFLKTWNIDGVILLYPDFIEDLEDFSQKTNCSIAVFDSYLHHKNVINVCSDDEKGLYLSTNHLIQNGHSHIAFVADYAGNPLLTKRFNGYSRALAENEISLRKEYVFPYSPTYENGIEVGKKIASSSHPISAVVTTADICAAGIIEGAKLHGLQLPNDLSVIGYDNLQICQFTSPKLTSISQNVRIKALLATKILLEKICSGIIPEQSNIMLDVELVERESVISIYE